MIFRWRTPVFFCTICLCLTLSSVVNKSFAQTRPSAEQVALEKKLIEGEKYTFLGDWEKAEPIFREILEEDVQNSAACYQLSRTLLATGKTADALIYIKKAIRIEPDNEWYLLMESDIHEKIGDLYSAMKVYEGLIRLQPKKVQYYEMLITFCRKTKENERLLATLDAYEKLTGVSESITRNRFETLDEMNRTDEALAAIHRLTEVYPLNTEYKYLAASYAKKIGKESRALEYYKQILLINPEDSRAKLALAGTEKKQGDTPGYLQSITPVIMNPSVEIDVKLEELIPYVIEFSKTREAGLGNALHELISQLVAAHPKEAKAYAIQGDVLAIAGKNVEAIEAYQKALAFNDNVYVVWEQMIGLLMARHAYDDVIIRTNQAIDVFPNQGYLYYASGFAHFKKQRLDEAMDMLTQALVMTGKNQNQKINVLNVMGMVYDAMGNMDKSILAFESSLAINPNHIETLAYYAVTLSRKIKQSERAIEMVEAILNSGVKAGYIHQIVAEVYYHQDKFDKAYTSIQIALQDGMDGEGYNLAGDIYLKQGKKAEAVEMWQKAVLKGYTNSEVKRKIEDNKL